MKKLLAASVIAGAAILASGCSVLAPSSTPVKADSSPSQVPPVLIDSVQTLEAQAATYGFQCVGNVQPESNGSQACSLSNGQPIGFIYETGISASTLVGAAEQQATLKGSTYVAGNGWIIISPDSDIASLSTPLQASQDGTL